MRRIRLVLALAAVMVVSLVAASPAYAIQDPENLPDPSLGLLTATETVGDPQIREAFETTSGLSGVGDPNITPAFGELTAQSALR